MVDPMRLNPRTLTDGDRDTVEKVKMNGLNFYSYLETIEEHGGPSRELSLAKTKIEEAVMWAVKHITR